MVNIRKVTLNMNENNKYITIKRLSEDNGNKKRAATKLKCSIRNINRLLVGYKTQGKSYFVHGNRGKTPAITIDSNIKKEIVDLYINKYYDSNFTHYTELLESIENINVSAGTVRNILMKEGILSPKARKITKRNKVNELNTKKNIVSTQKEKDRLENEIINIIDAHPRRPRCAYAGEMIQMDASVHLWFGNKKTQLHLAVDDSTGSIVGAYFDNQETLNGYYNVLYQILNNHGIPYMFYTDRRTVFEYKHKNSVSIANDTFTQFSYACSQLGIDIKTTSIPQAKGRIERMFQTLQSRLVLELRLTGVITIEQANAFLVNYIKRYNAQFALRINSNKSVFEKQPAKEKINLTLAVLVGRKIDSGHCIRFENKYYKLLGKQGLPVYFHKGTSCMVIKSFVGKLYATAYDKVYLLEEIPTHEVSSKYFDYKLQTKEPKKVNIPTMKHPWRQESFKKFLVKQTHLLDMTFEELMYTQAKY